MSTPLGERDLATALAQLEAAARQRKLSGTAAENIRLWLTEPRYRAYARQVAEHLAQARWQDLDDAFWTVIPFGTAGRRGRMYPIGPNAINERTIGESAQGLARYMAGKAPRGEPPRCAIAFDTRHRSAEFARLCAEIMVAGGLQVYFLAPPRPTPELSFLIREKKCTCGIMVSASHNPPSDNAVKCYGPSGGQLVAPHDQGVIQQSLAVQALCRTDFNRAVGDGRVVLCQKETDTAYCAAVLAQALPGPRDLRILYSPLHGVGASAVLPILESDGFGEVEVFAPHAEPNGDFPNVPHHVANPENFAIFDALIDRARQCEAELVLATDPDCDRVGCAAPHSHHRRKAWAPLDGNQIAVLLADYLLGERRHAGTLSPEHYLIKTLVTTEMVRRVGDAYGVRTIGDVPVGFKWICGRMDELGAENFVLGAEEAHGYLVGQYARDKDGAVASMLLAELAAALKSRGETLHGRLDALYCQHGFHGHRQFDLTMPGSEGMRRTAALMDDLRTSPPSSVGGLAVTGVRDYLRGTQTALRGRARPLEGPRTDLVIFDLADEGHYVAVRPSGTEPKVKFYLFGFVAPELLADLDQARRRVSERLAQQEADLRGIVARSPL
jgi:phosphoglucomutase/phosphomannomutase